MEINARFDQRAIHHYDASGWIASPMAGVERQMLDRIGDEVARATSLVRYAPNSEFSPHVHTGGEEFLVLDGVFSDEHGDFPAGTYVRNPPTSSHKPHSSPGCVIFVKLWQFDLDDRHQMAVNVNDLPLAPTPDRPGVLSASLHRDEFESVSFESWQPGTTVELDAAGGLEALVVHGRFHDLDGGADNPFSARDWLRTAPGSRLRVRAGDEGARVWLKRGHLVAARERFDTAFARAR